MLKSRRQIFLCLALGFFLFGLDVKAVETQPELSSLFESNRSPVKVVCFGDSVTGVYYHTGGRRAYTSMVKIGLERAFPQTEIITVNAGISGHTTANALQRIQKDVLAHKPNLVTIKYSLNDMTRIPLPDFEANMLNIVKQCHEIGAAVLLCTPNSVMESPGRPIATLEKYVATIRRIGKEHNLPVADCYAAFEAKRMQDEWGWSMILSDDIHPNMHGHKLIAETIVKKISGKNISVQDVKPIQPVLPFTLRKLKENQPVRILAMPPYDTLLKEVILESVPNANLEMIPWEVKDLTLQQIEKSADRVRGEKIDWVFIAVPWNACPNKSQSELRSYSWVLNKSLSFGKLQWDCVVASPNLVRRATSETEREKETITHFFTQGQDLQLIERSTQQQNESTKAILKSWWLTQWNSSTK